MKRILVVGILFLIGMAYAVPVKSMLGARVIEDAEGHASYTAADYIEDSLIVMWDAIENAGWDMHDENLGLCINLGYGGTFNTPYQYLKIGDDYVEVSTDNPYWTLPDVVGSIQQQIATAWLSSGDGVTVEILFTGSAPNFSRWLCGTKGGGAGSIGSGGCNLNGVGLKNYRAGYNFSYGSWNLQSVTVSRDGYSFYINGNLVAEENTPSFSPNMNWATSMSFANGAVFRFKSWRFYMRKLSGDEIRHNYEIDKARFNLP